MRRCLLTPDQIAQIAALAAADTPPRRIARQLGLPVSRITHTRKQLAQAGRIVLRPHTARAWTTKETALLARLIASKQSRAVIAARLNRTEESCRQHWKQRPWPTDGFRPIGRATGATFTRRPA
jgi:DNA-binding MarR family transcriptional regulator